MLLLCLLLLALVVNDNQAYISPTPWEPWIIPASWMQAPIIQRGHSQGLGHKESAELSTVPWNFRVEMYAMPVSPALRFSRRLGS